LGQPRRSARQGRPGGVRSGSRTGRAFAEVKKAATDIRKLLAQLELESFLRVSGGKGLHVVVPLNPMRLGPDQALCEGLRRCAGAIRAPAVPGNGHQKPPQQADLRRLPAQRRGATAVASYSLRARPGAPVALPIAWGDLAKLKRADAFTIKDVPAKLKRRRKDPGPASGK
jgi:bifunctional non-homologous end joining protein LigD